MKTSRFTDSQIIAILKLAEAGTLVPDLCRVMGISNATFYKWRAQYGGMDVDMMTEMEELEAENALLKRIYAEELLKTEILKEGILPMRDGKANTGLACTSNRPPDPSNQR